MAGAEDEPMHLYEVFQNCFNKIANKHSGEYLRAFEVSNYFLIFLLICY